MTNRMFSLEEANAVLPELEKLLARIVCKKESHERLHDEFFMEELLHEATKHNRGNADTAEKLEEDASHVDGRVLDLEEDLSALRALGCVLRSLEKGWVEFPAEREGQKVFWCWKKGEIRILHYRPAGTASLERFPL